MTGAGGNGCAAADALQGVHSYGSFDAACRAVLSHLRARFGLGLWFVSRTVGDDYVLLHLEGDGFDLEEGAVMRWTDSLCYQVVSQGAPSIVPNLEDTGLLENSPIAVGLGVGAYLGIPLFSADGELFGTLGAIDTSPQGAELAEAEESLQVLCSLLMTVLDAEMRIEAEQRRAERNRDEARTDVLCGIPNRRAWNDAIEREEARCRRYGDPAGIAIIDLDRLKVVNDEQGHAAGDALLRRTANVIGSVVRESDLVARLGGDEFGVLAPGATHEELSVLVDRISTSLAAAHVAASVGARSRRMGMSLLETWHDADREMYRQKSDNPPGGVG